MNNDFKALAIAATASLGAVGGLAVGRHTTEEIPHPEYDRTPREAAIEQVFNGKPVSSEPLTAEEFAEKMQASADPFAREAYLAKEEEIAKREAAITEERIEVGKKVTEKNMNQVLKEAGTGAGVGALVGAAGIAAAAGRRRKENGEGEQGRS